MSVKSNYSADVQRAWATVFTCAWVCYHKKPMDCHVVSQKEAENHFFCALIHDPRKALDDAVRGKYNDVCSNITCPTLQDAAGIIVGTGMVLPFPEPLDIEGINAEQLRQIFDQEGITGILRFT